MKVILKNYVTGKATESDMEVVATQDVELKVPEGSKDAIVLKNLFLSCDPYMRGRMTNNDNASYISDFIPGEVYILSLFIQSYTINFQGILCYFLFLQDELTNK
jgi:NADPH-dependent curcumin reductase CurA